MTNDRPESTRAALRYTVRGRKLRADLLADKPEVGHAALVRCGLRLRVTVRPHGSHRSWLVGSLDLGAVSGSSGGSGHGRNGCSFQPYPELPFELAFAA